MNVCGTHATQIHVCMTAHFVQTFIQMYVCVCLQHRGLTVELKPLRAVYTNTLTKDTSSCQTGREMYLPDNLEHLGLLTKAEPKIAATLWG